MSEVFLVCFSDGPLAADVPLQSNRFGLPSAEAATRVEIRRHVRHDDPVWFDGWRNDSLLAVARQDLGPTSNALVEAAECHTLVASAEDSADLVHLQACWACARWLVARGATVVLDAHAVTFLPAAAVAGVPPDAPFDIRREVRLVYETDATLPRGGHVLHTRGLRKLGRPDLLAVVGPEDVELVSGVIWQVAAGMADGWSPAQRHGLDLDDRLTLYLVADDSSLPARLGLNNDALRLVQNESDDLIGLQGAFALPTP